MPHPSFVQRHESVAIAENRLRILIVDDEALVCRGLERVLKSRHELVVQSIGGAAGLARLSAGERFDFVLCDVSMPYLDGLGFLLAAEKLDAGLVGRIALMSGAARPDIARALTDRYAPIVEKPLSVEAVRALAASYRRRTDA